MVTSYIDPEGKFAFIAAIPYIVGGTSLGLTGYEIYDTVDGLASGRVTKEDLAAGYLLDKGVAIGLKAIPGIGAAAGIAYGYLNKSPVGEVAANSWKGAGPAPGTFGLTHDTASVKGLQNYYPKQGSIEFVFDPNTSTFVVGKPLKTPSLTSPHQNLSGTIGANPSTVVGGMFSRGKSGEILTNEFSGHYWQNWTPDVRQLFVNTLEKRD